MGWGEEDILVGKKNEQRKLLDCLNYLKTLFAKSEGVVESRLFYLT